MAQSIAPDEMHARTVPYVPPPPVRLRTEVDVVEVPVVVRDGQHRAVAGLAKNNFEVYDTGVRQTITAFSEQRFTAQVDAGGGAKPAVVPAAPAGPKGEPRPRFATLCFDDLNMDALSLKPVKEAAERFVKTALAPGDRVAVVEQIAKVTTHRRSTDDSVQQCLRILDLDRLHFETRQDRRAQKLTLVGVLLDDRGTLVTGKRSELDLNFTDATFAQLAKAGLTVSMTLPAPPGSYAVRGVVEDALEGKLTAASGAVEVRAIVGPPPEARPQR
jgi:VWFA-related protein